MRRSTEPRTLDVVVVEDEFLIAMDVEMRVEDAGHRVVASATTATEAVEAVERNRPDIVLMDLRLADGSFGGDAAREIYMRFGTRSIFLSGNLDPAIRAALAELEPIAMINKPFLSGELEHAIAAAAQTAN